MILGETETQAILRRLGESEAALACHELNIIGHSQNSLATKLSELSKAGVVVGSYRRGFRYKEWRLARPGELPLGIS